MKKNLNIVFILFFLFSLFYVPKIYGQKISPAGISLIRYFEGTKLKAYLCPARIWTIGVGHTGNDVYPGMVITPTQEIIILRNDLNRFEIYVGKSVERNMKWHEFDAIVCWSFNVGFRIDEELKDALDKGNIKIVLMKIIQYNKARVNGSLRILPGLVTRRKAECSLYRNTFQNDWSKALLAGYAN